MHASQLRVLFYTKRNTKSVCAMFILHQYLLHYYYLTYIYLSIVETTAKVTPT